MKELTASEKAKLQEVADGILKVYRTLVRMQFLPESWIEEGPHDMTALQPIYEELGLDASIIYLYSVLPYVRPPDGRADFFQGGEFIDFRNEDEVIQGRDPMYAGESESNMRPWMTPLSSVGNHYSAIIYDARKHAIGIFGQMDAGGSRDHNIHEGWTTVDVTQGDVNEHDDDASGGNDGSQDSDKGSDSGGDSEGNCESDGDDDGWEDDEEEDEDEDMDGECHWDEMDCRPAANVLRDMVLWFEDLTELPGGGESSGGDWDPSTIKPLYVMHGWPRADFDGEAFLVDHARAVAASSAKWDAEEPLRKLEEARMRMQEGDTPWVIQKRKAVEKARRVDDEWFARWELELAERVIRAYPRELAEAEARAERLCPGGQAQKPDELPLWELRQLRQELGSEKRNLARLREQVKEAEEAGGAGNVSVDLRNLVALSEKSCVTYQKACEVCEAEVERMCPGKSLPVDSGALDFHASSKRESEMIIKDIQEWLLQVPPNAYRAREAAQRFIEEHEASIRLHQEQGRGT